MTRIFLIRHGETEWNKIGRLQGHSDVKLSPEGIRQAQLLAEHAPFRTFDAIYSSDLSRAVNTAKILAAKFHLRVVEERGLREVNFGEWEGKTADELRDDPDFQSWLAGDNTVKPPRGESNADFVRRICKIFESIVEGLMKTGTTECAIVTHGGVIMTLLAVYGLPQAKPFEWTMDNGYGYSLRVTPMLWQRGKVCEVFAKIPEEKL